jgi:hypothetical protein
MESEGLEEKYRAVINGALVKKVVFVAEVLLFFWTEDSAF